MNIKSSVDRKFRKSLIENNVDFKPELCYCPHEFVLKLRVANMCSSLLQSDLPGLNEILLESELAHAGNEMRCARLGLRADSSGSAAGNSHSSPALRST
jgi:hypothetical protein